MGINVQQGAVNTLALGVPGVYIGIIPPQPTSLNATPANIAGFVGTASYGPVNTPMPWADYGSFQQSFGPLIARAGDLGTAVSIAVQQGANNGYAVRVTDGTDTAATVKYGAVSSNYALLLTAKYTGSAGNSFTAAISASAYPNAVKVTLTSGLAAPEVFDGITTSNSTAFWAAFASAVNTGNAIRGRSNYFIATTGTLTGSTAVPATGTSVTLSGGADGATFTTTTTTVATTQGSASVTVVVASGTGITNGQLVYGTSIQPGTTCTISGTTVTLSKIPTAALVSGASLQFGSAYSQAAVGIDGVAGTRTGMYALRGSGCSVAAIAECPDSFTFSSGSAPTVSGIDTWAAQAAFGLSERIYMVTSAAAGDSPTNWQGYNAPAVAGASGFYSLKVMFGDWLYWSDTVNSQVRLVSPQAFVVGRLANQSPALSALNQPIYGVVGSQFSTSGLVYSQLDIATIQSAGFDVIVPPGQGPGGLNIWTCATGNNANYNPAAQGDNYTTMTNYIVSGLAQIGGLGIFLGKIITPALSKSVLALLNNWFTQMWSAGLIGNPQGTQPFQNTNTSTPTQQQNGITVISTKVQYGPILRELALNFQGGQTVQITQQSSGLGQ